MKLTNPKTKDGLDYSGLLGLENAVFCKGRLKGKNEIKLPDHWKKLIDEHNITVHLTPVGAPQELVVRCIQDKLGKEGISKMAGANYCPFSGLFNRNLTFIEV